MNYATINNIYYNINNDIYNASFYECPTIKHVISEEEFNKLEKKCYNINNPFNNTCPITQIEFLNDEEMIELPCTHCFNPIAIKKWLMEEKGECPVCRYKFETIEQPAAQPAAQTAAQPAAQPPTQPAEENLIYNPNEFNNVFNNFMVIDIIYVYMSSNEIFTQSS